MREPIYSGGGTPFNWPLFNGYGRPPYASVDAGPFALTSGADGLAIGAFAWVDPDTGQARNTEITGGKFGFVLPVPWLGDPEVATFSCVNGFMQRVLRPGMACVIAAIGEFQALFPQGAQVGMQVYADPATGLPYTNSNGGAYIATKWTAMQGCGGRSRARISSFISPFN
jgi:hypothetical protein